MKIVKAVIVNLVLAVALFATGAQAASAPPGAVVKAPDWSPGSEWHYSDGYAVKVSSVSPKGAVFDRLDAPGQQFTRQGFIRTDSISATTTRNAIYRTIPDVAGLSLSAAKPLTFQREYLSNGKLLVHASSWSVEGRETITVPAGTFDCWVIVWRTRSLRSDWTGFERWWYSPEAQNYVRMEFKYGPGPDGSRVLMNYHLAGSQPAPLNANAAPAAPEPVAVPLQAPIKETRDTSIAPHAPWHVLLASAEDAAWIRASLDKTFARNPQARDLPSGVTARDMRGRTIYRAWLGSYANRHDAKAACAVLKMKKPRCSVFKEPSIMEARAD